VRDIKLLDYVFVFIPANIKKLHRVLFFIVPAERRVECYESLHDANDFHYESLNGIIKFHHQIHNGLSIEQQAPRRRLELVSKNSQCSKAEKNV
jgi:hypothetical protein